MRTYKMEGYFSVPLDRAVLRAHRQKAGFKRAQDFDDELKRRGYEISYSSIEYSHGTKSSRSKIRGDNAEIIAKALGFNPDVLFPGYSEAKAAAKSADQAPLEREKKHMDVFFKVPVDMDVLKRHRERRGYTSKRQMSVALHKSGSGINYQNVECAARYMEIKYVRGDVAAEVAAFLGLDPNVLFPGYDEAKALAEHKLETGYYRPFATMAERNAAILNEMDTVKKIAVKFRQSIRCEGVPLGWDEVISVGYEALCEVADLALKKGIPNGAKFGAYACESVKNALRYRYKAGNYFNVDVFSLEAYTHAYDLSSPFDLEEYIALRDEAWRAVQTLPDERKQDSHIQQLIIACFPGVCYV